MVHDDIHINAMFTTRRKGFEIIAAIVDDQDRLCQKHDIAYLSRSLLTTAITRGLGLTVSRFPLGI